MLARCDDLIVLKIPGWELSKGVADEIVWAKELNISIEIIDPTQLFKLKLVSSKDF